jgi:dinuclear metal center YbgI/SA1388 family protein
MNNELTLSQLHNFLDKLLEPTLFTDYCPNGLQIQGKEKILRIGTAVSASLETLEAAVAAELDALIVHHGLFWKGDPFPIVGNRKKKIALLLGSGLSLFAYHLPLDAHNTIGNNWQAAADLNWHSLLPFGEFNGAKIGVLGKIEATSPATLQAKLELYYEHTAHYAPGGKESIEKIALISGGAHKAISEAAAVGADAFITGSFDEPIWHLAKEEGIHFYAMGHSATERVGPRALGELIEKTFGVSHTFVDITNPF